MSDNLKNATVYPVEDRIFVKRHETNVTSGGIHVPDTSDASCMKGTIAAVGPGVMTLAGERVPMTIRDHETDDIKAIRVGDGVIYSPDVAEQITLECGSFDVMRFRDVICVLRVDE